jgi:nitrogen regulatory protein PII
MKEIKAYFRPAFLDAIVGALEQAGAADITIIRADAIGRLADVETDQHHIVRKYREKYSTVIKLELVCHDEDTPHYVEVIRRKAYTGEHGDGRVFVSEVAEAFNIRTGAKGVEAL